MPEEPQCAACGYSLKGIESPYCPECGADVASDPAFRYPSLAPSPWSARRPKWLLAGVLPVLFAPQRTLAMSASPQRVTRSRAAAFAILVTVLLIALWPVIKEGGLVASMVISSGGAPPGARLGEQLWRELTWPFRWRTYCGWEAWSVARWWLMFAILAVALPSALPRGQRARRLLLFAPWIALLEIGYLVGVWFVMPTVVPEPNTLFVGEPFSITDCLTNPVWLVRGVVPTLVAGLVYARAVLGWNWSAATVLAVGLVPISLILSALWTLLFMSSGLLGWLYGW